MFVEKIWEPNFTQSSQMQEFMNFINLRHQLKLQEYQQLHRWSVTAIADFWQALADFYHIKFHAQPQYWFKPKQKIWQSQWLGGATLNYAENILDRKQQGLAIQAIEEDGRCQNLSFNDLRRQVAATTAMLRQQGIQQGDRVVGITRNDIPAIVAFLACASMGAIWANCSPDFGETAILERFKQLEPKLLFTVTNHRYQGKTHDHRAKIQNLIKAIPSLTTVVWLDSAEQSNIRDIGWSNFIHEIHPLKFTPLPFDHPLFILFSSGTTGKPKCIMHRAGGVLLEHFKDLGLHTDLRQGENFFFYTTTGWMMWNWMISALGLGSTLVLYEGSPAYPQIGQLMAVAALTKTNVLGASAAFFASLEQANYQQNIETLSTVRTLLSTGSPLLTNQYHWLQNLFGRSIQISSISGGTDIVSCFALGNPCLPVYPGELQCLGLGMDVQVFNNQGQAVIEEEGELVCAQAFPTIPLGFWGDDDDQNLFQQTYFEQYPGVWAHGDFAKLSQHQSLRIYGRSDTTLNPHGVRFGSAELYAVVNPIDAVRDSIAVSQAWQGDTRVILFVALKPGRELNETLHRKIVQQIRQQLSPRHVPAKIIQVTDVPKTLNGKLMEGLVQKLIAGKPIYNQSVVANPECLAEYQARTDLAQ